VPFSLTSTDLSVTVPERLADDLDWVPALLPGGVHESLLAAGLIPHPFRDQHEHDVRWVEDRVWWYRGTLQRPASGDRVRLVLPSVDTVATVWFNGVRVGDHVTAFRPFEADVTDLLADANELVVRIQPPLEGLEAPECSQLTVAMMKAFFAAQMPGGEERAENANGILTADLALTRRRKPTFSWGWDFAPQIACVGLLEAPVLQPVQHVRIDGHHARAVRVDVDKRTAHVAVDVEVTGGTAARVTLTSPSGAATERVLDIGAGDRRTASVFLVEDAELWWTHDLGTPALYDLEIALLAGDSVIDTVKDRIGLRTVELDRSPDPEEQGARFFRFLLNGASSFSRGANWVPASMLRGSVSPEHVRRLVELAARGEMNMIRVWGGGAYEQDAFYEACDELGVLVWQDFMFACISYPGEEPELQAETAREAEFQVRRLRNHASLGLWCGNNEVHGLHDIVWGTVEPSDWGWHLFHAVLPDAVSRHSPGAIYWPGSPWSDSDAEHVNGVLDGDRHAWEVWHGTQLGAGGPTEFSSPGERVHFTRYGYDMGRYISEFGIHAAPQLDTLQRWTSTPLELGSEALLHRIKDTPKDKGFALIAHETGEPRDLEDYVDFSMAVQAEGLKHGVEHYRRREPHCSGTLVWQLNDPWPGLSWSVIDSDLVPKAGYWFLQRAFAPVIASFRVAAGEVELWVSHSGRAAVQLELTVEIATFDGGSVLVTQVSHVARPGVSQPVWSASGVAAVDRFAWVSEASGRVPTNRAFFGRLKELPLGKGAVEAAFEPTGPGAARVHLTARGFSYFTRVTSPVPGPLLSANYLDLRDGTSAVVDVTGLPVGADPSSLLRVSSWQAQG